MYRVKRGKKMSGLEAIQIPSEEPAALDGEWQVDIVSENELRFTMSDVTTQKRMVESVSNPLEEYDMFETLEIAAFLSRNAYLLSMFPDEMEELRTVLYKPRYAPPHKQVVEKLRKVMSLWYESCRQDDQCIAPPSRSMMTDPQFAKIVRSLVKSGQMKEE